MWIHARLTLTRGGEEEKMEERERMKKAYTWKHRTLLAELLSAVLRTVRNERMKFALSRMVLSATSTVIDRRSMNARNRWWAARSKGGEDRVRARTDTQSRFLLPAIASTSFVIQTIYMKSLGHFYSPHKGETSLSKKSIP